MNMVTKTAANLNGISIAYVMGFVNALFAVLTAYGLHLTDQEIATTTALINAGLILAVHFGHRVGQATASGAALAHSTSDFGSPSPPAQVPEPVEPETVTAESGPGPEPAQRYEPPPPPGA